MPSRPLQPCGHPGCSQLVERGRCGEHETAVRKLYDAERGSSNSRGYGARWRRLRAYQLARDPLCEDCREVGVVEAANEVDHRTPREQFQMALRGSTAPGGSDHESNLQSLCKTCHSRKTAVEDGRWTPKPLRAHDVNGGEHGR